MPDNGRNPQRTRLRNSIRSSYSKLPLILLIPFLCVPVLVGQAPPPALQFTNVTAQAGIKFVHYPGNKGIAIIREVFGPGVCVGDFDGDGWQDVYFVNGRDLYDRGIAARNALYHNNGDGTFTDVTESAGVPGTGYGLGCVWGDYDNDGFPDLFVTQYGRNVLYHNNGHGTFTDVTDKAGVAGSESGAFHSGATFFDYDRDGRLDLYVGSYVDLGDRRYCDLGGVRSSCPPSVYRGSPDALYHNNGDGTFINVTVKAKIYQPEGKNLSVGAADYDNDGWPDLFVANDGLDAYLYHNQHDGKGFFDEVSDQAGITRATHEVLSFGGGFFDYDNDGWLDIFIANGHVYPEVEQATPGIQYKQTNSLFHNQHNGKFLEVSKSAGNGFQSPYVGRGVAFADFDNDGFVDVVVANNGDVPLLLHNSGGNGNHFLNFRLIGTKSNHDAMGARIRVLAGGISQIREIEGGGSYLSQSDLRANFGLGKVARAETVEIKWPGGLQQTFRNVEADKFYLIEEGSERLGFQPFTRRPMASHSN